MFTWTVDHKTTEMLAVHLAVEMSDTFFKVEVRICGFSIHGSSQQQIESNSNCILSVYRLALSLYHK